MSLVQALRAVQDVYQSLPNDALQALAARLGVKPYRLQEVASFFPHFRRERPPAVQVLVCRDMACHLAGAARLLETLKEFASAKDKRVLAVKGVSCLGRCDRAPVVCVERFAEPSPRPDPRHVAARAALADADGPAHFDFWATREPATLCRLVEGLLDPAGQASFDRDEAHAVATNDWLIDVYATDRIPRYEAARRFAEALHRDRVLTVLPTPPDASARPRIKKPDYAAVKGFLESHYSPAVCELLEKLSASGLRGMGGAGQAAFEKWFDVLTAPGEVRYVVANGDESEPATFKDRELMLRTPHLIVEGVILAGLLLGAQRGYLYIRHEYAEGIERLRAAIREAEQAGVCGANVFGTTRAFPVEVFISPGGYICGEQSALLEAMEDRRAEPRNRPPELATNGLHDCPTLVSNVETLAWMPAVALKGADWYANQGKSKGKGRRLFSISGDVARPGVYEVSVGAPLKELLELAGGIRDPKLPLKAVAPSGPSGGFVPPTLTNRQNARYDLLQLPLDIDEFRRWGLMLGAGLVVYDESRNLAEQALNATQFFRNESCGKCVPCRLGSEKLVQIGKSLAEGQIAPANLEAHKDLITELGRAMEFASICGLGQVTPNPLRTLLRYFATDIPSPSSGAAP